MCPSYERFKTFREGHEDFEGHPRCGKLTKCLNHNIQRGTWGPWRSPKVWEADKLTKCLNHNIKRGTWGPWSHPRCGKLSKCLNRNIQRGTWGPWRSSKVWEAVKMLESQHSERDMRTWKVIHGVGSCQNAWITVSLWPGGQRPLTDPKNLWRINGTLPRKWELHSSGLLPSKLW